MKGDQLITNYIESHTIGNTTYICEEEWRPIYIDGNKTYCDISNLGRVYNHKRNTIYKEYIVNGRYKEVSIQGKLCLVSRLVAIAFIPIPQKYIDAGYTYDALDVDHIKDGDNKNHEDNSVWNLQWLPHRENYLKAYYKRCLTGPKNTKHYSGENHIRSKYTKEQAMLVRDLLLENKLSITDIAKQAKVSNKFVKHILYDNAWHNIIGNCDFSEYLSRNLNMNGIIRRFMSYGFDDESICNLIKNRHDINDIELMDIIKTCRIESANKGIVYKLFSKEMIDAINTCIRNFYTKKEIYEYLVNHDLVDRNEYHIKVLITYLREQAKA